MATNKDLLKLENEYRNDLPNYKEKPKMTPVGKPTQLTNKLSSFLAAAIQKAPEPLKTTEGRDNEKSDKNMVEMDIYITPTN